MENRKVLIIDRERDFCFLICHFFSQKGLECHYAETLREVISVVNLEKPDLIIADKNFHKNLEGELHNMIDASDDYDPDVYLYTSNDLAHGRLNKFIRNFGR